VTLFLPFTKNVDFVLDRTSRVRLHTVVDRSRGLPIGGLLWDAPAVNLHLVCIFISIECECPGVVSEAIPFVVWLMVLGCCCALFELHPGVAVETSGGGCSPVVELSVIPLVPLPPQRCSPGLMFVVFFLENAS